MAEKVIEKKKLDAITKDGEEGFFIPGKIFHGEDCIIIVSVTGSGDEPIEKIVSKAENNIMIYSSKIVGGAHRRVRSRRDASIELKVVGRRSPLYTSLNKALDEVIAHRISTERPQTLEEFLDEL